MVSAIIVTHGRLAEALIATAKEIFGNVSGCRAVSNLNKSPHVLREELDAIIAEGGPEARYVVFVDFYGGSCCHTCMGLDREHENVQLVTGVNLPMFLAFLYLRDDVAFEELPDELLSRGHESIQLVKAGDE